MKFFPSQLRNVNSCFNKFMSKLVFTRGSQRSSQVHRALLSQEGHMEALALERDKLSKIQQRWPHLQTVSSSGKSVTDRSTLTRARSSLNAPGHSDSLDLFLGEQSQLQQLPPSMRYH